MTYESGYSYLDSAFASLDALESAMEYKKIFKEDNYRCLKYEDLIANPTKVVRELCDFLGVEFNKNMLKVSYFKDNKGKPWSGDSTFIKRFKTISKKPASRWKKHASALELYFVEMINRRLMPFSGYDLSGNTLNKKQWLDLYFILNDKFLFQKYRHWLKTGKGYEGYPSKPPVK